MTTIEAGTNRLLVVAASDPNATSLSGVTFGGVALTYGTIQGDSLSFINDSIWYLRLGNGPNLRVAASCRARSTT